MDKPVAIVTGLRAGRYTFSLTVSDQEGLTDSAFLTVRVQEGKKTQVGIYWDDSCTGGSSAEWSLAGTATKQYNLI